MFLEYNVIDWKQGSKKQRVEGKSCRNLSLSTEIVCVCLCLSACMTEKWWRTSVCAFVCVFVNYKWKKEWECVCLCVCVCVSLSADASGPTECEMEQGGSGSSRDTLQHTHTHTRIPFSLFLSLALSPFILFFSPPSLPFHPFFSYFQFHPLFFLPLLYLFFLLLPSFQLPLYLSASLSLWIKLSLLWSLFFPLLCLYLPFGCRVFAIVRERERHRRGRRERGSIPMSGQWWIRMLKY